MTMEVNLKEVRKFIKDPNFTRYLIDNTTDFSVAVFILQTLIDATASAEEEIE